MRPQLRFVLPAVSALLAIALALVLVLSGHNAPSSPSGAATGSGDTFAGAAFPPGARAPDFTLSDQHGRKVSLGSYHGQVVALAFLSPDCRTCVLVAQQVRGALDELGASPGVHVIFVSNASRVSERAHASGLLAETSLTGRVEYLTGAPKQLERVWHAYRILPVSTGEEAAEAAVTVLLIDRKGFERVGFGVEQITPEGLAHDIRLLEGS